MDAPTHRGNSTVTFAGAPARSPFAPANDAQLDIPAVNDLVRRLRHWFAPAQSWDTRNVTISAGKAHLIADQNPLRISLAVKFSTAVQGQMGHNSAMRVDGQGLTGFTVPSGGGFLFGPEMPLRVYVLADVDCVASVIELFGDV